MAVRTKVLKSISAVPEEEWNKVFPDISESYRFLKSLEESCYEQFSFVYMLVYENRTIIGATVCFLMGYPLDTTIRGPLKKLALRIKKRFPGAFSIRTLVCGLPMSQGRIGIRGESEKVVAAVCKRMERIAKKEKASVVAFKDFDSSYDALLEPVLKMGFQRLRNMPNTLMDLSFSDFEEYLRTLSAATRYDLRRKFRRTESHAGLDLEITNAISDETLAEGHRLYLETVNKHEMTLEVMPVEFFRNVAKNMPDEVRYFLWRHNGKMVAFSFCLLKNDYFIDYYLGFDYSVAYKYNLYFIKFRDIMKWCLEHRVKRYEFGITDYEPKKRLGFNFIPLYVYAKHRNALLNPIFRVICLFLQPDNFDPILKKLKRGR